MDHQQVQKTLQAQDEILGDISNSLTRLRDTTVTIGNELDIHNDMLRDFHDEIDDTHQDLERNTSKLKAILDKGKECCTPQLFCIFFLALVFLVLILVVIYG